MFLNKNNNLINLLLYDYFFIQQQFLIAIYAKKYKNIIILKNLIVQLSINYYLYIYFFIQQQI